MSQWSHTVAELWQRQHAVQFVNAKQACSRSDIITLVSISVFAIMLPSLPQLFCENFCTNCLIYAPCISRTPSHSAGLGYLRKLKIFLDPCLSPHLFSRIKQVMTTTTQDCSNLRTVLSPCLRTIVFLLSATVQNCRRNPACCSFFHINVIWTVT